MDAPPRLAGALLVTVDAIVDLLSNESERETGSRAVREAALPHPTNADPAKGGQQLSLISYLARSAPQGRAGRELLTLRADALMFMGQLVWDASQRRDHATTRDYYDESVRVARHLRDHTLEGRALRRTCYVAVHGAHDPRTGLDLARQAADTAWTSSPAVTGLALLHAGEAHAMLGEAKACERALADAQRQLEQTNRIDDAADLVSSTQFGRLAGSCHLSLGQHRCAQDLLETTAAELQDHRKSRAIVLGNLTLAYIRQGEVDAAVGALSEAIAGTAGDSSAYSSKSATGAFPYECSFGHPFRIAKNAGSPTLARYLVPVLVTADRGLRGPLRGDHRLNQRPLSVGPVGGWARYRSRRRHLREPVACVVIGEAPWV
ncbi:hypothetical protein ACQPXS_41285 [Streptomyces sp. CA-142005]|uniref:hypothetical protein n=1 Tax=Streptomyces sp. CA-142005 TaxID=3240052 RepID=UPI003D91DFAF